MDSSTTRGTALGLSLIALLALSVTLLAECSWAQQLRLSPMVLGVVLGMLLADTLRPRLPEGWDGAFRIAGKQLLRAGIVFYGCRLTLEALTELGPEAILIDTIIVLGTLLLGELLGHALGLERSERLLIASGSAICGAAAVLATEPVVRARSHSTVVAVGTVVLFGTLSMFVYPLLYRWGALEALGLRGVGICLGASGGMDSLHHFLEADPASARFRHDLAGMLPFSARNPLYAVVHESCWADGGVTAWAAERVRPADFDDPTLLTGEHVRRAVLEEDPALRPWLEVAEALAAHEWDRLYDADALSAADVPGAAAVYAGDVYVPMETSLATASLMPRLRTWVTSEYEHDGSRASGGAVFRRLRDLAAGVVVR